MCCFWLLWISSNFDDFGRDFLIVNVAGPDNSNFNTLQGLRAAAQDVPQNQKLLLNQDHWRTIILKKNLNIPNNKQKSNKMQHNSSKKNKKSKKQVYFLSTETNLHLSKTKLKTPWHSSSGRSEACQLFKAPEKKFSTDINLWVIWMYKLSYIISCICFIS